MHIDKIFSVGIQSNISTNRNNLMSVVYRSIHLFSMKQTPPTSTLFPYTTLFRSRRRSIRYRRSLRPARWSCGHSRSEEHTSELQSLTKIVCRLLLEKKKTRQVKTTAAAAEGTPAPSERTCLMSLTSVSFQML